MNLSTISKSLLIALPMLALGACSTNADMDSESTESTTEQAVEKAAEAMVDSTVQTDAMEAIELTEAELMSKKAELTPEESDSITKKYTAAILDKTILFDFDKAMIRAEFTPILDAHAKFLVANPAKSVTIEGHADEKGTPEYNIALGERRAMSVATYLEGMGVSSSQINVVSYGEEKPANLAHSEAAWAENRRAVLAY